MKEYNSGKLIFNYGVMNSAKSLNLIAKAYELKQRGFNIFCFKPATDNRHSKTSIVSRAGLSVSCELLFLNEEPIKTAISNKIKCDRVDYILIDEVQFLSAKDIDELAKIVDKYNVTVICHGLLTDFKTCLFSGSKRLVEVADELNHITSQCACGRNATINARINKVDNSLIVEGEQIVVGGEELYETMCRKCYYKKLTNQRRKQRKQEF